MIFVDIAKVTIDDPGDEALTYFVVYFFKLAPGVFSSMSSFDLANCLIVKVKECAQKFISL